jgi:hypothetical protein
MHAQLAEEHVVLMGATSYRLMAEIVANGDDPTFPRMAELPKIVFSKTLTPPLTWANTTIVDEPVETAVSSCSTTASATGRRADRPAAAVETAGAGRAVRDSPSRAPQPGPARRSR